MKKEDLLTAAEFEALLAGNEEYSEELERVEPLGAQDLNSLQEAVKLLTKQVEELQLQLHEQFEYQNRQQEQFLRLCRHQLDNKLHEQLVNTIVVHQQAANQDDNVELQQSPDEVIHRAMHVAEKKEEEPQLPFSRVKSYGKIRKRRKGFLEKLFE
ncbi:hypothetical protein A8709_05655 [Paenibacillus pectinilyticus]|uniref:Uncharacterized protein n=1 Tax=Paenibacillus pectinilyticus TaxID=512399 RepID=A0A1C0ZSY0_9BACL|nr:hypothetical protein [Paenibacillus pectinilyticus]OCT11167.1 hypothetical protein A8709_05655 [Paenibacillus pectinilyticus]